MTENFCHFRKASDTADEGTSPVSLNKHAASAFVQHLKTKKKKKTNQKSHQDTYLGCITLLLNLQNKQIYFEVIYNFMLF